MCLCWRNFCNVHFLCLIIHVKAGEQNWQNWTRKIKVLTNLGKVLLEIKNVESNYHLIEKVFSISFTSESVNTFKFLIGPWKVKIIYIFYMKFGWNCRYIGQNDVYLLESLALHIISDSRVRWWLDFSRRNSFWRKFQSK